MRMVIAHVLSSYAGYNSYGKLAYGLEKPELKPNVLELLLSKYNWTMQPSGWCSGVWYALCMIMVIIIVRGSNAGQKPYGKLAYGLEKQELKPNALELLLSKYNWTLQPFDWCSGV